MNELEQLRMQVKDLTEEVKKLKGEKPLPFRKGEYLHLHDGDWSEDLVSKLQMVDGNGRYLDENSDQWNQAERPKHLLQFWDHDVSEKCPVPEDHVVKHFNCYDEWMTDMARNIHWDDIQAYADLTEFEGRWK